MRGCQDDRDRPRCHVRAADIKVNVAKLVRSVQAWVADCSAVAGEWDDRLFRQTLAEVPNPFFDVARPHPDIKLLSRESVVARFAAQNRDKLDAL